MNFTVSVFTMNIIADCLCVLGLLRKRKVELAYIVKNEAVMVYVNAYTGEVIGGDYFKAVSGGAGVQQ